MDAFEIVAQSVQDALLGDDLEWVSDEGDESTVEVKAVSPMRTQVEITDVWENKRTFHVMVRELAQP